MAEFMRQKKTARMENTAELKRGFSLKELRQEFIYSPQSWTP